MPLIDFKFPINSDDVDANVQSNNEDLTMRFQICLITSLRYTHYFDNLTAAIRELWK